MVYLDGKGTLYLILWKYIYTRWVHFFLLLPLVIRIINIFSLSLLLVQLRVGQVVVVIVGGHRSLFVSFV